ncbi:sugar phosphate isomerase/epimerase [soil metagenome]
MHRRHFLRLAAAAGSVSAVAPAVAAPVPARFPIGVCDWTIGRTADPEALAVAGRIGIDGVQVDFGRPADPEEGESLPLLNPAHQTKYLERAGKAGNAAISSLALGVLNEIPYKSDPRAERWVLESVEVAKAMGQEIVLLAFFGAGDLREDPAGIDETVARLERLAPVAEKAGIVYGIESWLKADVLIGILDRVGSPNVQVYYDLGNMHKVGADIYAEIAQLGRDRICEIHAKDYDDLYGKGSIDFPRAKAALDAIGYDGWIVMEGTEMPLGVEESNRYDLEYLRNVFAEE